MDLLLNCEKPHGNRNSLVDNNICNNDNVSFLEICFICNKNLSLDVPEPAEKWKEKNILKMFFDELGPLEKQLHSLCTSCKSMIKNIFKMKDALSTLIDEISSLLHKSKTVSSSSHILPKSRIITRLIQLEPDENSSSSSNDFCTINQIETTDVDKVFSNKLSGYFLKSSISTTKDPNDIVLDESRSSSINSLKNRSRDFEVNSAFDSKRFKQGFPLKIENIKDYKCTSKVTVLTDDNYNETSIKEQQFSSCSRTGEKLSPYIKIKVPNFACSICSKRFKCSRDLNSHVGSHTKEKPFMCDICGVGYRQKRGLDSHIALHKGESLFECEHCGKGFTQKSGLQRHLPIHTGETLFQCDLCGKGFLYHSSFAHHKLTHTGERKFHCDLCDQSFLSKSHLNRHNRIHSGEKPFACEICHKAFHEKFNLKAHLRVHTGNPAHKCPECPRGFSKKHQLTLHLSVEHQIVHRAVDDDSPSD